MISVTAGSTSRPYVQHLALNQRFVRTLCGLEIKGLRRDGPGDEGEFFRVDASLFPLCGLCEVKERLLQ